MESVFKLVPLPSLPYKDSYRASNLSDRPHSAGSGSAGSGSGSGPSNSDEGIAPGSVNEPIHLDTNTNTIVDAGTTTASGNDPSRAKAEVEQLKQKSESAEVSQMSTENTREDGKNTLLIAQLEEYMMAQVHAQQRKTMTRAQRINEDKLAENESSEFNEALELLKVKTGLSNKQALMYGVSVAKQVFEVPGKWGLTMMSMQALATALPSTAVFMGPAIAGLTVLLGPLAVVGLAQLVWTGVNLAIGPSLWCLYGPLVLMSNQRIVLALQDMQVEKFY